MAAAAVIWLRVSTVVCVCFLDFHNRAFDFLGGDFRQYFVVVLYYSFALFYSFLGQVCRLPIVLKYYQVYLNFLLFFRSQLLVLILKSFVCASNCVLSNSKLWPVVCICRNSGDVICFRMIELLFVLSSDSIYLIFKGIMFRNFYDRTCF